MDNTAASRIASSISFAEVVATIPRVYQPKLQGYLERIYRATQEHDRLREELILWEKIDSVDAQRRVRNMSARCHILLQCQLPNRAEWIGLVTDVTERVVSTIGGHVRKTCNCPSYRMVGVPSKVHAEFDTVIDSCDFYTWRVVAIARFDMSMPQA